MTRTLTSMYDTRDLAESARDQLAGIGVTRDAITIHGAEAGTAGSTAAVNEDKGFWASLADFFMPDEDRHTYSEGLRRGGYLLSARVPDELEEAAADILEGSSSIDLDERSASWRQEGWTGYDATTSSGIGAPAAAAYGEGAGLDEVRGGTLATGTATPARPASPVAAHADRTTDLADGDVVQAAEEELQVGKREVGRGSVRVRSYVTERPVEEQVDLRQERVTIERRPVDREVAPGDATFAERTIEAVERGEEAVVSKVARVTEEIGLRKDVEHETETVRDTVRKQEVEVEDDRAPRKATGTGTVVEGSVVDPDLAGTSR